MSSRNVILAVVGLCGTGKSVVTRYIEKNYKFKSIYFGGFVLEEVKKRNLEINSTNEKIVREDLRKEYGLDVMAKKAFNTINSYLSEGSDIIIDGLYSFSEYIYLKEKFPKQLFLLAIHSPKKFRYQRLGKRKIRPLTPEQVDERDFFEIKNIEKAGPIAAADYHIINHRSIHRLHQTIHNIVRDLLDNR
jgi:dephospho-CoA kinase